MTIKCCIPNCTVEGAPEAMWLPEWQALRRANGGRKVGSEDLHQFAMCSPHGRLLRKEKVRVYRFSEAMVSAIRTEKREEAERENFKPFAAKFLPVRGEQNPKQNGTKAQRPRSGDGRHTGQGLSHWTRLDREEWKAREARKTAAQKSNGEVSPAEPAISPPAS